MISAAFSSKLTWNERRHKRNITVQISPRFMITPKSIFKRYESGHIDVGIKFWRQNILMTSDRSSSDCLVNLFTIWWIICKPRFKIAKKWNGLESEVSHFLKPMLVVRSRTTPGWTVVRFLIGLTGEIGELNRAQADYQAKLPVYS